MSSPNRYANLEALYERRRIDRQPLVWHRGTNLWLPERTVTYEDVLNAQRRLPYIVDGGCAGNESMARIKVPNRGLCLGSLDPWNLSDSNVESIAFAAEWLMHNVPYVPLPKVPRTQFWLSDSLRQPSTYWLKHVIESATGRYISNGEQIIAAEIAGLPWHPNVPNPHVGIRPTIYEMIRNRAWRLGERRV